MDLLATAVLAHLEQDLDTRIADHFDLITGTPTGGIITFGLGLGMRPAEILEFYLKHGPAIFPPGTFIENPAPLVEKQPVFMSLIEKPLLLSRESQ